MLQIANPTYQIVFKHLLEDNEAARLLLSAIIGETIEELEAPAAQKACYDATNTASLLQLIVPVFSFEFSAKIKTADGDKSVILKVDKARFESDMQHNGRDTPEYFDAEFADHSVYFLNGGLGVADLPVASFVLQASHGGSPGDKGVKTRTYRSHFVQLAQIKNHRRSKLEKLLAVFAQGAANTNEHAITINETEVPEEYTPILRRLAQAAANKQLCAAMTLEDKIEESRPHCPPPSTRRRRARTQ